MSSSEDPVPEVRQQAWGGYKADRSPSGVSNWVPVGETVDDASSVFKATNPTLEKAAVSSPYKTGYLDTHAFRTKVHANNIHDAPRLDDLQKCISCVVEHGDDNAVIEMRNNLALLLDGTDFDVVLEEAENIAERVCPKTLDGSTGREGLVKITAGLVSLAALASGISWARPWSPDSFMHALPGMPAMVAAYGMAVTVASYSYVLVGSWLVKRGIHYVTRRHPVVRDIKDRGIIEKARAKIDFTALHHRTSGFVGLEITTGPEGGQQTTKNIGSRRATSLYKKAVLATLRGESMFDAVRKEEASPDDLYRLSQRRLLIGKTGSVKTDTQRCIEDALLFEHASISPDRFFVWEGFDFKEVALYISSVKTTSFLRALREFNRIRSGDIPLTSRPLVHELSDAISKGGELVWEHSLPAGPREFGDVVAGVGERLRALLPKDGGWFESVVVSGMEAGPSDLPRGGRSDRVSASGGRRLSEESPADKGSGVSRPGGAQQQLATMGLVADEFYPSIPTVSERDAPQLYTKVLRSLFRHGCVAFRHGSGDTMDLSESMLDLSDTTAVDTIVKEIHDAIAQRHTSSLIDEPIVTEPAFVDADSNASRRERMVGHMVRLALRGRRADAVPRDDMYTAGKVARALFDRFTILSANRLPAYRLLEAISTGFRDRRYYGRTVSDDTILLAVSKADGRENLDARNVVANATPMATMKALLDAKRKHLDGVVKKRKFEDNIRAATNANVGLWGAGRPLVGGALGLPQSSLRGGVRDRFSRSVRTRRTTGGSSVRARSARYARPLRTMGESSQVSQA